MKRIKHLLETVNKYATESLRIINYSRQQYSVTLELLGLEDVARGVDERLQQVGDYGLSMCLTCGLEALADEGNMTGVVSTNIPGVPADIEQDDEALNLLHDDPAESTEDYTCA